MNRSPGGVSGDSWREGALIPGVLLSLSAFALFWFFRAAEMTGGDSDQWCREIEMGVWWRKRQMFSFASMQLSYLATNALWNWNGRLAINLTSCLAGAFFVYCAWRLVGGALHREAALALLFSSGFIQLFFGHIETYAMPMAWLMFLFLTLRRCLAGHLRAAHAAFVFSVGTGFHLLFWFVLPIFAVVLRHSRQRRRDSLEILLGLSPAILFTAFLFTNLHFGRGEMIGDRFMPLFRVGPGIEKHYALLSVPHLMDWLWFVWNASHFTLPVLFIAVIFRKLPHNAWIEIVGTNLICLLIFTAIWHPDAGRLDWDLFSFSGLPIALLASDAVQRTRIRWHRVAMWVAAAASLFFLASKVIDSARLGARGTGTVLIVNERADGARMASINLDGHSKSTEIHHVLEGNHHIGIYLDLETHVEKHEETFTLRPGETYTVIVPATSP